MPVIQVKKVVAVCFLEATKMTLEHIGAHRLEHSQRLGAGTSDLPRLYGDARRLRDYLQRCVSAYQDQVDLDLSPPDQGLLVACCRRSVEWIEMRLKGEQVVSADEKHWLQKKMQVVSDWAVELGDKPLVELPLPRLSQGHSEASRGLLTRLQQKLFGDVSQRKKIRPPTSGLSSYGALPGLADDYTPPEPMDGEPEAVNAPSLPFGLPATTAALPGSADLAEPAPVQQQPPAQQLVSTQHMRDPRLRSLVVMDLGVYSRVLAAKDYRLAVVMLSSVLEGVVLDHAMPRRVELGLTGTPDTWNPQELLVRIMGEAFEPKDLSLAYHLFSARNLLRPALQIMKPMIVTASSLQRLQEFVQRAVHRMGLPSVPLPAGGLAAANPLAPAGEVESPTNRILND